MKLFWILGIVFFSTLLSAQVRVVVPKSNFQSQELIRAQVVNATKKPISVCLEAGQWSMEGNAIHITPIPFLVQRPARRKRKYLFRKRWSTLLIGPDIGSTRVPLVFSSGESQYFPFRLSDEGPKFRLLLYYWKGQRDLVCSPSPKGSKKAISSEFQLSHADISAKQ
jgi:hypothetical protein